MGKELNHNPSSLQAGLFRTCRSALLYSAFISCFINILMLTGPLFMLQVYDRVLSSRSVETLTALTVLVLVLFTFIGLLELIRNRILSRTGKLVDENIGRDVFSGVLLHSLKREPNANAQALRDLDTIRYYLASPGPLSIFDAPWTVIYLWAIFIFMHTWMGLFATAGCAILLLFTVINHFMTHQRLDDASRSNMSAHIFAEESRRNTEVVHAMGMKNSMLEKWEGLHEKALRDYQRSCDRGSIISSASKAIRLMLQSTMLALGAYLVIQQEITAGTMIAASIIMSRALAPIEQCISQWRSFQNFRHALKKTDDLLKLYGGMQEPILLPEPIGNIHVDDIMVAVADSTAPLLRGINFQLEPGQVLGVIGPSGAGKSTFARTLVGLWPVAKGNISIDGAPIHKWNSEQIGKSIGYLPQDVELFAGSIQENISRFSSSPNHNAVLKAAQLANVHDLIMRQPNGYQTPIGENGVNLSAGQRQRIGLARALYGDPVFVVLDEPNSNLDMEGEVALVETIQTMKANGTTVVVVAHRSSALQTADFILLLQDGRQAAFTSRDEFLEKVRT